MHAALMRLTYLLAQGLVALANRLNAWSFRIHVWRQDQQIREFARRKRVDQR